MLLEGLRSHRVAIYALLAVAAALACSGLGRLHTEASYRVYFDPDDPLLALDRDVAARFELAESAVLIVEAAPGELLSPSLQAAFGALAQSLLSVPHVTGVSGFHQFLDVEFGDGDDPFAETRALAPEDAWQRLRAHPLASRTVSADGRHALVWVQVDLPEVDAAAAVLAAMGGIRAQATRHLLAPGLVDGVAFSGVLALNAAYIEVVRHDLILFVPGLLLLMAGVLYAFLRDWRLVALPLGTAWLAAFMTMGIAGWGGWTLAAINVFTPIIVVSLHLAASMHLVMGWVGNRARGLAGEAAMAQSLAFNLTPMTLSAVTTAAGFLLLSTSPSPPIRVVGYCVALGVGLSYLINVAVLPLLLGRVTLDPAACARVQARLDPSPCLRVLLRRRWPLLIVVALVTAAALPATLGARIDDRVYTYFPAAHEFSRGTRWLDDHFNGCVRLSYVLDSAPSPGLTALSPDYREQQLSLVAWLAGQARVGGVEDIYAVLTRAGLDLTEAEGRLRGSSVAELGVRQLVEPELRATRVEVALPALNSRELIAFDEGARRWSGDHPGPLDVAGGSGPDLIFAHLGQRNAHSMFLSLGAALAGIGVLMGLLYRRLEFALLGLLCNLLPLLLVYSVWFGLGGYISLGAAVVLGMILGVIVDDTLHLLCKYQQLVRAGDADPIHRLGERALPAVIITSITLALGFAVGLLSDFRPLRELSGLSAAVIAVALLLDAFVLPVALTTLRGSRHAGAR